MSSGGVSFPAYSPSRAADLPRSCVVESRAKQLAYKEAVSSFIFRISKVLDGVEATIKDHYRNERGGTKDQWKVILKDCAREVSSHHLCLPALSFPA